MVRLFTVFGNYQTIFSASGQWLSLVPGTIGVWLRRAFYRMTLEDCGADFSIGFLSWISSPQSVIGKRVYIGSLSVMGTVELDDNVLIGSSVHVLSGRHQHSPTSLDSPMNAQAGTFSRTSIGSNVWIGNGAIVMANIDSNTVIGAGSVVVRPIDRGVVAVGNPAKVIKALNIGDVKTPDVWS